MQEIGLENAGKCWDNLENKTVGSQDQIRSSLVYKKGKLQENWNEGGGRSPEEVRGRNKC